MTPPPWNLLDTTLREGEQFAPARFRLEDKVALARHLDAFGVRRLEVTNPAASPGSFRACERIADLGLDAEVVAHARATRDDVAAAADAGADGVNVLFATSEVLRRAGHGREVEEMLARTGDVVGYARERGLQVRFACEDAFRTPWPTLRSAYRTVLEAGAQRLGLADTVGVATPRGVRTLVRRLRRAAPAPLEFHGHDDTGCAVANAFEAAQAGAEWIHVSVLGLGERNGITATGAFLARMYALDPEGVHARYDLSLLPEIDRTVARMAGVEVPFNTPLTGRYAYHHKAGMHLQAILNQADAYEAVPAEALGRQRTLELGSALVGRHALAHRARQLGLALDDGALRRVTRHVKARAEETGLGRDEVDRLLRGAADAGAASGATGAGA